MGPPPIQTLFGLKGIGDIEEGIGSGFQVIGRDARGPKPTGCLAVGNQEEEVGSGSLAIGSIGKLKVKSDEF